MKVDMVSRWPDAASTAGRLNFGSRFIATEATGLAVSTDALIVGLSGITAAPATHRWLNDLSLLIDARSQGALPSASECRSGVGGRARLERVPGQMRDGMARISVWRASSPSDERAFGRRRASSRKQ